jgi:hypothetical protein
VRAVLERVDQLLRGGPWPREGVRGAPPAATLLAATVALGAAYGACMGIYGWRWGEDYGPPHVAAVALKVPLLLLASAVVTGPSLYVFGALAGSDLRPRDAVRLMLAANALIAAALASLAPVTVFFTFSTRSHPFLVLLNAALFALAGSAGLRFLWRSLAAWSGGGGRLVVVWLAVHGLVAAQMGWILRPFVGAPHLPFELFRRTESNVLRGLIEALRYVGD